MKYPNNIQVGIVDAYYPDTSRPDNVEDAVSTAGANTRIYHTPLRAV